jgi:hypothetical protein
VCVIYSCSTAFPPEEELKRGAYRNDDGGGIAWLEKERGEEVVFWKKGLLDAEEILTFIKKQKIGLPAVIHFRTASVGGKDPELAHPFPLGEGSPTWEEGHAETVLFHNGHLSNWDDLILRAGLCTQEKFPDGSWSDSRALAWLTWLKGPGILPFIIGQSRVLLFSSTPLEWEEIPYDRSTDHFNTFGSWVHHAKEGWSQSIATDFSNRGGVILGRNYKGGGYFGQDDDEVEEAACSKAMTVVKPTECSVWTVTELKDILARMEKEMSDARIAAGI